MSEDKDLLQKFYGLINSGIEPQEAFKTLLVDLKCTTVNFVTLRQVINFMLEIEHGLE